VTHAVVTVSDPELGYVGRDVEEVIKDLVEAAQSLVRTRLRKKLAAATAEKAEAIIVAAIAGVGWGWGTYRYRDVPPLV
jgi:ATP-dependent HslUV protease ATP-binding subunit HslU